MTDRLTDQQLDEIEKLALHPHRQLTLPTMRVRRMVEEIRELRDTVCTLQMKIDGTKAIVDAVVTATNDDGDPKISAIMISRPDGPPFRLVDALLAARGAR